MADQDTARSPHPRMAWPDVWRVGAAALVFATHYKPWHGPLRALAAEGHTGVALFFVLSGLLLGRQLFAEGGRPRQGWRAFFWRRGAKIYTLHTLLYLACLPLLADTPKQAALSLTLTKGLVPAAVFAGLPQSWSLTAELMCYGLLPLLVRLPSRGLAGALIGAGCVAGVACFFWPFAALYTVAGRGFAFCLGVALARWNDLANRNVNTPFGSQLSAHTPLVTSAPPLPGRGREGWGVRGPLNAHRGLEDDEGAALPSIRWLLALLLAALSLLALGTLAPAGPFTASTDNRAPMALLANTIAIPLVWAACLGLTQGARVPGAALWRLLAQSSYAFYLIHIGPVGRLVGFVVGQQVIWQFAFLWLVAVALHKLVENPILNKLARTSQKS